MHFVLTLHSHLPYFLNHGHWPHGSDWLCEAALESYLPLLELMLDLEAVGLAAPMTLGLTPILANQLTGPSFPDELDGFIRQRLRACKDVEASLTGGNSQDLLPAVRFWETRLSRLRDLFREAHGDLVDAFRRLEGAGRIELIASAATHALLPLLGREESVALQLSVGSAEHERLFGRAPRGCWIPECAYRPAGSWDPIPGVSRHQNRPGLEAHVTAAGFRFLCLDTHMADAGEALGWYGGVPHGAERFDATWEGGSGARGTPPSRSAYHVYQVGEGEPGGGLAAFVREPEASKQVWSRHQGYPGDRSYLEFHRMHWPGGLRLWRVTGHDVDLEDKQAYDPHRALNQASDHATHFAGLLGHLQRKNASSPDSVAMTPFDTELFGHWWFEGVFFLRELFLRLPYRTDVVPLTASQYLEAFPPKHFLRPLPGSWGANGDFSMWLNEGTRWTWERLWVLEDRFWDAAPSLLRDAESRPVLAQAAREFLLAQSSDWQFMISTGAVPDYAARRFELHCGDAELLLDSLADDATEECAAQGRAKAQELKTRDDVFPDILTSMDTLLATR